MRNLRSGERVDFSNATHDLRIGARHELALERIGALLVPLDANDRPIPDFGPIIGSSRELRTGVTFNSRSVLLDLAAIPDSVAKLTLILYTLGGPTGGTHLADLGELDLGIDSEMAYKLDLTGRREAALLLVDIYRRAGAWRLAANGQGFSGGLPAINRALNLELSAPDAEPVPNRHSDGGDDRYRSERPPAGSTSGGSGFAVTSRMVVTNFHVIEHGLEITASGDAQGGPAQVIAQDPVNDIALLALGHDAGGIARFRSETDIDLGEDIIVGGFPLQGLLGTGPQISAGNVSALTGIQNDSSQLQFNAPIGSGNSGGPIIDGSGLVVGLVRAVLRTDLNNAPIAQNINFGVKASLIRSFLHASGVTPSVQPPAPPRSRAEIAREARGFLYRIKVSY